MKNNMEKYIQKNKDVSCNMCNKEIAEYFAEFIAVNFHSCPIDENVNVEDCLYWHSEKCKKCLLKNAKYVKAYN